MKSVKKYAVKPKLSMLIQEVGGLTIERALLNADAIVEEKKDAILEKIDELVERIEGAYKSGQFDGEEIYRISSEIVGLSAVEKDGSLADAAISLCEAIDRSTGIGDRELRIVQVHIDAIRMLHRSDAGPSVHSVVLEGLRKTLGKMPK